MLLTTNRLFLRRWREEDRAPFAAMSSDPLAMQYFPALLNRTESDAFIDRAERYFDLQGFGLFAAELRDLGKLAGYVGLAGAGFMPGVEIGWRLGTEYWGRGLATEGAREVIRFGFEELDLPEIISFTVPQNKRSWRVMEKLGMTREAADDFNHPAVPLGHPLSRHVLYRLRRPRRRRSRSSSTSFTAVPALPKCSKGPLERVIELDLEQFVDPPHKHPLPDCSNKRSLGKPTMRFRS